MNVVTLITDGANRPVCTEKKYTFFNCNEAETLKTFSVQLIKIANYFAKYVD